MRRNLFIPGKMAYVRGEKKPEVDCILCAIVNEDDRVARLEVYRSELSLVTLNLYPYAPGHLMVFPKRHITDPRMLTTEESIDLANMQSLCLDVLDGIYAPHGYNIGYNIGEAGGASIAHLHLHIVPRYKRETGFIDILGGVKIIIEDPNVTLSKVKEGFNKALNNPL